MVVLDYIKTGSANPVKAPFYPSIINNIPNISGGRTNCCFKPSYYRSGYRFNGQIDLSEVVLPNSMFLKTKRGIHGSHPLDRSSHWNRFATYRPRHWQAQMRYILLAVCTSRSEVEKITIFQNATAVCLMRV